VQSFPSAIVVHASRCIARTPHHAIDTRYLRAFQAIGRLRGGEREGIFGRVPEPRTAVPDTPMIRPTVD
jgi:hypothetical protein